MHRGKSEGNSSEIQTHSGSLLGLSYDKKQEAIEKAKSNDEKAHIKMVCKNPRDLIKNSTLHTPIYSAKQFREYWFNEVDNNVFEDFDIEGYEEPENIYEELLYLDKEGLDLIRKIIKSNFELKFTEENLPANYLRISGYLKPFGEIFVYDKTITALIFEEYHNRLIKLDWDKLLRENKKIMCIKNTCELLAFYCGLVPYNDVYNQFKYWFPEYSKTYWFDEFSNIIEILIYKIQNYVEYFIPALLGYSDNYICANELVESESIVKETLDHMDNDYDDEIDDEEYGERIAEDIYTKFNTAEEWHNENRFSILPNSMKCESALEYCRKIPAIVKLSDYLEHHIPNNSSDVTYTRKVVDDFILTFREKEPQPAVLHDFFQNSDIGKSVIKDDKFMLYFKDALMSIPMWRFRGQPFSIVYKNEIEHVLSDYQNSLDANTVIEHGLNEPHETGKLNYVNNIYTKNADFEPKSEHIRKICRNEPCPCGSGKKYKKCCGSPKKLE